MRIAHDTSLFDQSHASDQTILRPDILFDISALADCFKPYGAHPLNLLLSRITPKTNSLPILLGNCANQFLDDILHATPDTPIDYRQSMRKFFASYPLEISLCPELNQPDSELLFFKQAKQHFEHLRQLIQQEGSPFRSQLTHTEPAFVSHNLGLQGRMDALTADGKIIIELKSGKADDWNGPVEPKETHYIQAQLYAALLAAYATPRRIPTPRIFLLYSKYPILIEKAPDPDALRRALELRNQMLRIDLMIISTQSTTYIRQLFEQITPSSLNIRQLNNRLWTNYLSKPINTFNHQYLQLDDTEKEYIAQIYLFITNELHAPTRSNHSETAETIADAPIVARLDATLSPTQDSPISGIRLAIDPVQISQTNFRTGDSLRLYPSDETHPTRQTIRATLEQIEPDGLILRFQFPQPDSPLLTPNRLLTIEPGSNTQLINLLYPAITHFTHTTPQRRALLMGTQFPTPQKTTPTTDYFDRLCCAEQLFLLNGPPGTGKTSIALRRIVEHHRQDRLLLLAHTNRAVDEICHTLATFDHLPYLRIGNHTSCDPAYRHQLLTHLIRPEDSRQEVRKIFNERRIIVTTVTTALTKLHLLQTLSFDLTVVDEASQVLEPHLIALFAACSEEHKPIIRKIVLIGDTKQLPAVVAQSEEQARVHSPILQSLGWHSLNESLFERWQRQLLDQGHEELIGTLSIQGRMHPQIADFPNQYYYDNKLQAVPLPHQSHIYNSTNQTPPTFDSLHQYPILLLDIQHLIADHPSVKQNKTSARWVAKVVEHITLHYQSIDPNFSPTESIGIIVPFRAQIAAIRHEIAATPTLATAQTILIDTVERYQGSQRSIIIYDFTVHHPSQLSWIESPIKENNRPIDRKLNVAITRAKSHLYLIGNSQLIAKSPLFAPLVDYLKSKKSILANL